jgi:hypothetical protein
MAAPDDHDDGGEERASCRDGSGVAEEAAGAR